MLGRSGRSASLAPLPKTRNQAQESGRHRHIGKPEIALRDLTGHIRRARRRIRRQIHRPQLAHPLTERADRIRPPDPVGDHRGRHPRIGRQQLPDPRLGLISHRASRSTLILRRTIRGQRRLHRVPRNPQHPRDLRNRQPLRPAQPPDLCPVLHAQHRLPPWPIAKALQEAGQFSVAAHWSVFSCRRQPTEITAKYLTVATGSPLTQAQVEDQLTAATDYIDDQMWCNRTALELGLRSVRQSHHPGHPKFNWSLRSRG